jgi:glycerophosphoryl diester phosphodiesterase
MGRTLLVHHAANRGPHHPPNSLQGLRNCLLAGARAVEVDITPLADGAFALLHDAQLEEATDGEGQTVLCTADQIRGLHTVWQGMVTGEGVGLLAQAVSLVDEIPHLQELQLDLKPHAPLSDAVLTRLLQVIAPVKDRVRVSCVADWAVRRLRVLDSELALGFDPLLYLDVETGEEHDAETPPFRVGAYGYRDDHPLSSRQWGTAADYLAARTEALIAQAPPGVVWYIRAALLARSLDDGYDWIAALHAQGNQVDAWTLDADGPGHVSLARRLVEAGVDRITTNDAPRLATALGGKVVF